MKKRKCKWNGIEYNSLTEAALDSGVTKECMRLRLKQGYTGDCDIYSSRNQIVWNGRVFGTYVTAATNSCFSEKEIRKYVRKGLSSDEEVKNELF